MVKRLSTLVLAVSVSALVAACGSTGNYKDGTYKGTGEGKNGPIKVEVTVAKGKITAVKAVEHSETPGLTDPVFKKITEGIVKAQKAEVDTFTGGTITSKGIMDATKDALKSANK